MTFPRRLLAGLFLLGALACGDALTQQESSYTDRQAKLEALATKADAATKAEITAKKTDIAKRYAALPTDKSARGDGLGKLNQELRAALDTYEPKIEAATKGAAGADLAKTITEMAGSWKGGGMTMTVGGDGSFAYEKKNGGSSKSFTGKISKAAADSFEAGALGINTTFKIDKHLYDEGGKKMMVIDGTPLTRD